MEIRNHENSIYYRSLRTVGESGERTCLKSKRGWVETNTVHYLKNKERSSTMIEIKITLKEIGKFEDNIIKATTIETKKGINGLCKNFRIIYETGTFSRNKPPTIIWYHFNFPIAWIPVEMGSVSDIIRASIRASFANITVYSGTFFNHNLNMYSIFVIKGIEIINSRKNDIFEAEQEILKNLCLSPDA